MYNFKEILEKNEKIIYEGKPNMKKNNINPFAYFFAFSLLLFCQFILIWSVKTSTKDGAHGINLNFIFIFFIIIIFEGLLIYAIIYDKVLKKQKSNDAYCITNKRVLKYNSTNNSITSLYVVDCCDMRFTTTKKNFGNIYIGIKELNKNTIKNSNIKDIIKKIKDLNDSYIVFESIENPHYILSILENIKNNK